MYDKFFGLTDSPFRITPDPRFLYLGPAHREALATLIYGIRERKGIVALTGGVGTGKTTLLEGLFERLSSECLFVRIRDPKADFAAIVRELLVALGLSSAGVDRSEAMKLLWERLSAPDATGLSPVLVIDEAQDVRDDVLEDFRLLSNLETHDRKLIQMLLVGQPEFRRRLEAPALEPLRQRIALSATIHPLTLTECTAYVKHRLSVAGAESEGIFAIGAFEAIHDYARGIPRLINVVCDGALSMGYATGTRPIHAGLVREVVQDLRGEGAPIPSAASVSMPSIGSAARHQASVSTSTASRGRVWVAMAAAACMLVLAGALGAPALRRSLQSGSSRAALREAEVAATPPRTEPIRPQPSPAGGDLAGSGAGAAAVATDEGIDAPRGEPSASTDGLAAMPSGTQVPTPEAPLAVLPPGPDPRLADTPEPRFDGVAQVEADAAPIQPSDAAPIQQLDAAPAVELETRIVDSARERQAALKRERDLQRERERQEKARAAKEAKEKAARERIAKLKAATASRVSAAEEGGDPASGTEAPAERAGAASDSAPPDEPASKLARSEPRMLIVPDEPEVRAPTAAPALKVRELYASHSVDAPEPSPRFVPGDTVQLVAVYELANAPSGGGDVSIDLWVRGPNQEDISSLGARRVLQGKSGTFRAAVGRKIPPNAPAGVYGLVARVTTAGVEARRVFLFRVD